MTITKEKLKEIYENSPGTILQLCDDDTWREFVDNMTRLSDKPDDVLEFEKDAAKFFVPLCDLLGEAYTMSEAQRMHLITVTWILMHRLDQMNDQFDILELNKGERTNVN